MRLACTIGIVLCLTIGGCSAQSDADPTPPLADTVEQIAAAQPMTTQASPVHAPSVAQADAVQYPPLFATDDPYYSMQPAVVTDAAAGESAAEPPLSERALRLTMLGVAAARANEFQKAESYCEELLKTELQRTGPDSKESRQVTAILTTARWKTKLPADAMAALRTTSERVALFSESSDPAGHELGLQAYEELLMIIEQHNGQHTQAYAKTLAQIGEFRDALGKDRQQTCACFDRAIEIYLKAAGGPSHWTAHLHDSLAILRITDDPMASLKHSREAVAQLEKIRWTQSGQYALALAHLANAQCKLAHPDATTNLQTALKLAYELQETLVTAEVLCVASIIAHELGDHRGALLYAQQLQQTAPDARFQDIKIDYRLGIASAGVGDHRSAEFCLKNAKARVNKITWHLAARDACTQLGTLYLAQNRLDEAEMEFNSALRAAKQADALNDCTEIALFRGYQTLLQRQGKTSEAAGVSPHIERLEARLAQAKQAAAQLR